jgi:hypothetical protein
MNSFTFLFIAMKETHEQCKTKIDIDEFRSRTIIITLWDRKCVCHKHISLICVCDSQTQNEFWVHSYSIIGTLLQRRVLQLCCIQWLHTTTSQTKMQPLPTKRDITIVSGNSKARDRMVTGINNTRIAKMPHMGTMAEGQTSPRTGVAP